MTLEVAIVNKQAVALAADSAVTIQGGSNLKIYNTVNKLFALSKYQPVGIMTYSTADVMGAPTETAIKAFRKKIGRRHRDSLDDYADEFRTFLETDNTIFDANARIDQCVTLINEHFHSLHDGISRSITSEFPGLCGPNQTEVKVRSRNILEGESRKYAASPSLPNLTSAIRNRLKSVIRPWISQWEDRYHSDFYLARSDTKLLLELALNLVFREEPSGFETGFVIAGFGESEYYPQVRSFEFEASINGVHKIRQIISKDMRVDSPDILPFAQRDIIDALYKGRDAGFDQSMNDFLVAEFDLMRNNLRASGAPQAMRTAIEKNIDDLHNQFKTHLDQYLTETTKNYTEPLQETVAIMPKEELALMAEALVNITSMHRKMSPGSETVGGPTDVAVISKGDGFVWIKRKHYFDPKYNHAYIESYFRR